jgi:putative phage-type endonuclease
MTATTAQSFDPIERRKYLGASEVAAVLGLDRYKTPLDVYNEKTGFAAPFEGNKHTERGNRLEAIAAEYYTEQTGVQLRRHNSAFVHEKYPFIVGHVDRIVVGEKRLVEIKCPSVAAFRRMQREGLPDSYQVQAQVYMFLGGFAKLTWVIFCADVWDAAIFDIEFDPTLATASILGAVKFWNEHVMRELAPDVESSKADIEFSKIGGTVTLRDDPKFTNAVGAYREAQQLEKDAKELVDLAKRDIADALEGEFGIYEGGGARVHYAMREGRKSFDKVKLAKTHPEIDLSQFEKTGSPYAEFRVYPINNTKGEN